MAFARLVPGGPLAVIDGVTFSISKVITPGTHLKTIYIGAP